MPRRARSVRALRVGLLVCAAGLAIAAAAQAAAPLPGPPLYDGVVMVAPYAFLQPSGSQPGGAQPASTTVPVAGGVSPAIALGTPESPPQAQLIAGAGALALPAGTTALVLSITPVAPDGQPATGVIAGNVYRVAVVNQAGAPVTGEPGRQVTLALRDPGSTDLARIEHLTGGAWQPLTTVSAATSGTYETTGVTSFGDFALVGTPTAGSGPLSPLGLGVLAAAALALLAGGLVYVRPSRRGRAS